MKYVNLDNLCIPLTEPNQMHRYQVWADSFIIDEETQMYYIISPELQRTRPDGTKYWLMEVICNGRQVFTINEERRPIYNNPNEYGAPYLKVTVYTSGLEGLENIRGFLYGLICDQCDGPSYVLK
jgi:hypothetical protein